MGIYLFDQYSLLHFATGVVVYFWDLKLSYWIVLQVIFEIVENLEMGIALIQHLTVWPGGKTHSDTLLNRLGDILSGILGWLLAQRLDQIGLREKWTF